MAGLWKTIKDESVDLAHALIILIKDAIFAAAVVLLGRLLEWLMRLTGGADQFGSLVKTLSDIGAIVLFIIFCGKRPDGVF